MQFGIKISLMTPYFSFKESISDFYWYYSGKDVIDEPGKKNFSKAMTVAKQIFNSLTEYIQVTLEQIRPLYRVDAFAVLPITHSLLFQGPCNGNQQSLAHSRLWDAIVGFLHVFAHMMMKLAQVCTYNSINRINSKLNVCFFCRGEDNVASVL